MDIENLLNIIDGEIINQPKVKKVEAATIYPSKVGLGDLYFAYEQDSIEKAVQNGAYAVVFEGENPKMSDREIAYIKVDSIKSATVKFLRYILIQKASKVYYFQPIESSLLKQLSYQKNSTFSLLPKSWQKSFETILNSDYQIFITTSKEDAKNLSPNYNKLRNTTKGYIVSDSLLKTTFRVDKYIYQNIEIPPFFFENLLRVITFCKDNGIEFDINRLKYTKEFQPYFIEDDLTPVNKGTTQKVLLFVDDAATIDKSIEYLRGEGRWIKSIALTPEKTKLETIERPYWYKTPQEAQAILKKEFYHYAFCYKLSANDIFTDRKRETLF